MGILRHDEILAVHTAIVAARLVDSRSSLLAGINTSFTAGLPHAATPGEQLLRDLDTLNTAGVLTDGSVPLSIWLTNAIALAGARTEQATFRDALEKLRLRDQGGVRESEGARSRPVVPNNLPHRRRLFVGRTRELEILGQALNGGPGQGRARWFAIHGLSGVGKTALALEVAHRAVEQGTHPGGVYWISADNKPLDRLGQLADDLRLIGPPEIQGRLACVRPDDPAERVARAVQLALQNHLERSLLVLDDLSEETWRERLPAGLVQILATTRDERLAPSPKMRLNMASAEDAVALAHEIAGEPEGSAEAAALERIVAHGFGGLTVAVEHAAMSVREWAGSWCRYEELLVGRPMLLEEQTAESDYTRSVVAAIDLSIERCKADSKERALLEAASVFAPDAIPFAWAAGAADLAAMSPDVQKASKRLEGLGLVTVDASGARLSIQHLIRWRVRDRSDRARSVAASRRAASIVAQWLLGTVEPTRAAEVEARRSHVEEALLAADRSESDADWIDIATLLGTHLRQRARFEDARALFERALERARGLSPPDQGRLATALSNLGTARKDLGRFKEAEELLRESLRVAIEAYGSEHRKTIARRSNLAIVLREFGDFRLLEAYEQLRRAWWIAEREYAPNDPKLAVVLSALALVLEDFGKTADARELLECALTINEQAYNPTHPEVATSLSNLATALLNEGEPERAKELLTRALAIDEVTYGKDHPKVATTLSNLADVMRALRRTDEARGLLQRALRIDEATYGVSSARVAARLLSLANVLCTTNLQDEEAIVTKALADAQPGSRGLNSDAVLRGRLLESIRATERWAPRTLGSNYVDDILHRIENVDVELPQLRGGLPFNGRTSLGMLQTEHRDRAVGSMTSGLVREALTILEAVHGPNHPDIYQALRTYRATLVDNIR